MDHLFEFLVAAVIFGVLVWTNTFGLRSKFAQMWTSLSGPSGYQEFEVAAGKLTGGS